MLRSLKLSKANSGAKADPVQASREQALRAARDEAELALASAKVERKQLEARVAELEGKPAERDHAARVHALDGATAKLQSLQESAAHDQALLRDEVAQRDRTIEQLEHRLQGVEHRTGRQDATVARLQSELGAAQMALAEERKARYVSDDRLRVAESRAEGEAGRRAHAAERQVAAMAAEGEAREVELGKQRGAAEVASAERDDLRSRLEEANQATADGAAALAEARAELTLLRQAVTGGSVLHVDMSDSAGAGDAASGGPGGGGGEEEEGRRQRGAGDEEPPLPVLARRLRQQAAAAESADAARAAAEAAAREARRQAESAHERSDALEEELAALKGALLAAEASADALRRERDVPALDASAELEARDARIFELAMYRVPSLEQQAADALAQLARCEAKLAAEKEAKEGARGDAAAAQEALRTAEASVGLARDEAAAAEAARVSAEARAAQLGDRLAAAEGELAALRDKETAYALREYDVSEAASTSDVARSLLEEQARLLTISLKAEEGKVGARDEMLRSLQGELEACRKRNGELEQRHAQARALERRSDAARLDADAERDEMREKLNLAMMEVQARAERLEHAMSQVSASRGEIRSLENQLAIANNQLALVQAENASLAAADANKGAQLASAVAALRAKEGRLEAAEAAVAEAREESGARRAELTAVAERLGAAHEERQLLEEQLLAASHARDLMRKELELARMAERSAHRGAHDERVLRIAHEGRVAPLREALRQREADVADAEEASAGRVLLVERLQTSEASRVAEKEKAAASERRAAAAELKASHAEARLEMVRQELGRRESRIGAMRASLAACEEELSLLRASKELLAARQMLSEELHKQRGMAQTEEAAMQSALTLVKSRQVEAADLLVRAAGKHAAEAAQAARDAQTQAADADAAAGGRFDERIGRAQRQHARGEAELSELHGRLMAARLEVEASGERATQLAAALHDEKERARAAADALAGCQSQAFHNHCVLAKVLVNTRRRPANVLADELYEEAREKGVPISEWPNWVVHRMSGGEPLSRWLQGVG